MDVLCLNAMRKFIANVKHHIYARIYTDVNIYSFTLIFKSTKNCFNANIYNTFTAYVKVQTYLHHICNTSKVSIYLRMYLLHVCSH